MHEFLPILIVGAIIGTFTIVFVLAYLALQKHKEKEEENERHSPTADSPIFLASSFLELVTKISFSV